MNNKSNQNNVNVEHIANSFDIVLNMYNYKKLIAINPFVSIENMKLNFEYLDEEIKNKLNLFPIYSPTLDWITSECLRAIVRNGEIFIKRREQKNFNLHKARVLLNEIILDLVKKIVNDSSLSGDVKYLDKFLLGSMDTEDKLLRNETINDYEVYFVKDIPFFKDKLTPELNTNKFYHGTHISKAQSIVVNGFINSSSRGTNMSGYTTASFYNNNKVFFSNDFETAKDFAMRYKHHSNCVVFEVDLSKYDVYSREHLLIERRNPIAHFVKDTIIDPDTITKIYYLYDGGDRMVEFNKELLLLAKEEVIV